MNCCAFRFESEVERYTYIDVWEGGKLLNEGGVWAWWGGTEKNREWLRAVDSKRVGSLSF
jgi:hypothetical protein